MPANIMVMELWKFLVDLITINILLCSFVRLPCWPLCLCWIYIFFFQIIFCSNEIFDFCKNLCIEASDFLKSDFYSTLLTF